MAELDLDPSEELRVWAAPWPEAEALLRSGRMDHALVHGGLPAPVPVAGLGGAGSLALRAGR